MNIADFIQRGNTFKKTLILLGIILVTALLSLGLGLLQGKSETGTSVVIGK